MSQVNRYDKKTSGRSATTAGSLRVWPISYDDLEPVHQTEQLYHESRPLLSALTAAPDPDRRSCDRRHDRSSSSGG